VSAHVTGLTSVLKARARSGVKCSPFIDILIGQLPWSSLQSHQIGFGPLQADEPFLQSLPNYPTHPFSDRLCQQLSKLPTGLQDLCYTGEISRTTISILEGIAHLLPSGNLREPHCISAFDQSFQWGGRNYRARGVTTIDALLLQGTLALCTQHGFEPDPALESAKDVVDWMISIDTQELQDLSADLCVRDALVWIHLCAVGSLTSRTEDEDAPMKDYAFLLDRVFNLFEDPRDLGWRHVLHILKRFWFPALLRERWKACWKRFLVRHGLVPP
jgi:hypothetical protein